MGTSNLTLDLLADAPAIAPSGLRTHAPTGVHHLILDTETTGLGAGHRIVELAVIELVNRKPTGREFHHYLDPEREIDRDAQAVHGISRAFLRGKPKFRDIAEAFLEFVGEGRELVAHNAPFDLGMLNAELSHAGIQVQLENRVKLTDTLSLARRMFPGQSASLDALCERFRVSRVSRKQAHGALIDARLLAQIYVEMTREQGTLNYGTRAPEAPPKPVHVQRGPLVVLQPTADELAAHEAFLDEIERASGGYCGFRGKWPPPPPKPAAQVEQPSAAAAPEFGSGSAGDQFNPFGEADLAPDAIDELLGESAATMTEAHRPDNDRSDSPPPEVLSGWLSETDFTPSI
jgi:DNA polymerase III subunit epsilon